MSAVSFGPPRSTAFPDLEHLELLDANTDLPVAEITGDEFTDSASSEKEGSSDPFSKDFAELRLRPFNNSGEADEEKERDDKTREPGAYKEFWTSSRTANSGIRVRPTTPYPWKTPIEQTFPHPSLPIPEGAGQDETSRKSDDLEESGRPKKRARFDFS